MIGRLRPGYVVSRLAAAALLELMVWPAIALAGPPFQTDDPEPVDLHQLQRDVGRKWTLGGEAWYHGPEGPATPEPRFATLIDLGGYYYFIKPGEQLLFCIGHTAVGQPETYAYLGLYWTWGSGD